MNILAFSNFIQRSLESTSPEDDNLQVSQNLLPLVIFSGEKMNMQRNKSTNFYMHHDSVMNTSIHSGMIDVHNLSGNTHVRSKMYQIFYHFFHGIVYTCIAIEGSLIRIMTTDG
jgi:hypothetical protein